jgi:hypothetical protein
MIDELRTSLLQKTQKAVDQLGVGGLKGRISDGYHTFDELYEHRAVLFMALCRAHIYAFGPRSNVWRSEKHSDGTGYDGWFVLGIGKERGEQITYHLPTAKWEETDWAETLEFAPCFDGHTSEDVLKRLKEL